MIDVCCLQEDRCRGPCAMMLGMKGRSYELWFSVKRRWSWLCGSYGEGGVV